MVGQKFVVVFVWLSWAFLMSNSSAQSVDVSEDPQVRLLQHILGRSTHEKIARPVRNGIGAVNVSIRMSLYQLIDVDEPKESIELHVWMNQYWQDALVAWNPADFGNISWVVIPAESIWVPDTCLYNGLVMKKDDSEKLISMELSMDYEKDPKRANVRFAYPAIYKYSCKMNVLYFPFDQQICTMTWGSWVHDITFIDYWPYRDRVDQEQLIPNGEWELINFTSTRDLVKFSCCENPYAMLRFRLTIKRRPLYIVVNLVIPIVLIVLISVFGFFTPDSTERGRSEKVSLGINTLLAMSILLLMVADKMPTTATFVPLMGWFFLVMIALVSGAILLTAAIIQIQRVGRNPHRRVGPRLRRFLFSFVAGLVRMSVPNHLKYEHIRISTPNSQQNRTFESEIDVRAESKVPPAFEDEKTTGDDQLWKEKLEAIREEICKLAERKNEENEVVDSNVEDWEWVANVTERFCLLFFVISVVVITSMILLIGWLSEQ